VEIACMSGLALMTAAIPSRIKGSSANTGNTYLFLDHCLSCFITNRRFSNRVPRCSQNSSMILDLATASPIATGGANHGKSLILLAIGTDFFALG
jgi:hypothetical protein